MLSPRDAFSRLMKDGAFVEQTHNVHIQWYWHILGEFKCMARRNPSGNDAPTFYREFHDLFH